MSSFQKGMPARVVHRALLEEGVKVSFGNHGVDVGACITPGRKRQATKLRAREDAAAKKARRVSDLVRIDGRCNKLGVT